MDGEETLDETDTRVLEFIKSYDFETYAWNTAEASAQLALPASRIYQALSKIGKLKRGEVYFYFRDGGVRIQTE